MGTGNSDDYDDDDDGPRRRRDRDSDDRPRRRHPDDDDDRPRRSRRTRRRRSKEDYSDDNYIPWRSRDPLGSTAMYLGIASILLVIISVYGFCCLPVGIAGVSLTLISAIVAVILGSMARNRTRSGMGLAGIIIGISGIALGTILALLLALGIGFLARKGPGPPNNPPGGNPILGPPAKGR